MQSKAWPYVLLVAALMLLAGCNSSGRVQNSTDVRVMHALPDAEALDFLLGDDVKWPSVAFGTTSPYANFEFGTRTVKARTPSGTVLSESPQANFGSNGVYTVIAYGRRSAVSWLVLGETTSVPAAGRFRARFVSLSSEAQALDVYTTTSIAGSAPTIPGLGYGAPGEFAELPAGSYPIVITTAGTKDIVFQSAAQTFEQGTRYTIVALPATGGLLVNAAIVPAGGEATLLRNQLARVRAVNAAPASAPLNFRADGTLLLSNVPYQGVSDYVSTATGTRTLQLEVASQPGTTIASSSRELLPARDYMMVAAGGATPQILFFADDNTIPPTGSARVRFANLRADGGAVDAKADATVQASALAASSVSAYVALTVGTAQTISFTTPGGATVLASLENVTFEANGVYTIFLFGTGTSPTARLVRDR